MEFKWKHNENNNIYAQRIVVREKLWLELMNIFTPEQYELDFSAFLCVKHSFVKYCDWSTFLAFPFYFFI